MSAVTEKVDIRPVISPLVHYFLRPVRLIRGYEPADLRPDLIAGLTVAVIMLPQAIAFAIIAELPPAMGLYAAVVGAIVGALWSCSDQLHPGPTNAISLLVFSALTSAAFEPGTTAFVVAAGLMTVMAGAFQLALGVARLGILVNFVSHSVVVGFAAGAKQIRPLLGLTFEGRSLPAIAAGTLAQLDAIHIPTAAIGLGSIALLILLPRLTRRLPPALVTLIAASAVVALLDLRAVGVSTIGQLTASLPPLAELPLLSLDMIARLSTGALAVGAIGLVQTVAMARSLATQTGQRLDSNQEFVGQGLANIASGLFSGFAVAGSFSRSAVNLQTGARTSLSAVFSGLFVLAALFVLGPLAVLLPRAALAGILVVIGLGLVDRAEMARIARGTRGDALIMLVTFLGTLFLPIAFAVLVGILLSFVRYTLRTSMPHVYEVLPDEHFSHFARRVERDSCPQLAIVDVLGDLYFGAVNHIEQEIHAIRDRHPERRFLLLRMHRVNHCDFSGIHMLENVVSFYRDGGGDVYIVRVNERVRALMKSTGFEAFLGTDHFLPDDEAISFLFHQALDPAVCIYECPVRAFHECQNLPKQTDVIDVPQLRDIPEGAARAIRPAALWQRLSDDGKRLPLVIDVREPREYRRRHIPGARLVPLPTLLSETVQLPRDKAVVLVCRAGRRSQRAAYRLQQEGFEDVAFLQGGMLAWEGANLLCAVELPGQERPAVTELPYERENGGSRASERVEESAPKSRPTEDKQR